MYFYDGLEVTVFFPQPDLMYYWAHSEAPAALPTTPGRLHTGAWPPCLPLPDVATIQPARPGARYSEAGEHREGERGGGIVSNQVLMKFKICCHDLSRL